MLLTHWFRSILSLLQPSRRPLHRHCVRSRYGNHAVLNHQRRLVTVEALEDRTLLTSIVSVADRGSVEGDSGLTTLVFTVTRTGVNAGDLNESLTIDFTTQDGSATNADNDYLAKSGSFEFAASSTATSQERTFEVKIQGDFREEGDESFQVLLSTQMSGVTIENDSVTVTIYDDEYRRVEETQLLSPPAPVIDGDHVGQIIEVDGDYMLAGAPDSDLVASDAGAVYIYERNRQGTADETDDIWSYSTTLTAFDGAADDHFGSSIAISGDTIVIGAYGADLNQSNEGAAYVFRLTSGEWQLETKLTASNSEADDDFGFDVAIENDLIVIGAPLHDAPSYSNSGAAYIFTRSGSLWSEDQILTETEFYSYDNRLGTSIAIENGEVFVAARRAKVDDAGASVGSVFTYQNNVGTWETQQQLTLTFTNGYDYTGSDLIVSGNHLAVIAADYSYVYLFELTEGNWGYHQRVSPVSSISSIRINSIDLSDNTLVVGSIKTNASTNSSGIVTEYQLIRDQWIRTEDYYGESSNDTTGFGTGVALADSQIIVGEPNVDASALESGMIHVLGPFIPGYEIYDVIEYEGDSGQTLFEYSIERKASEAGDLNFASTISFTTIDGTATVADNDYVAQSGTLTFDADLDAISQFQTVTIAVNGDGIYEGDEYFYLQLFNPTNGTQLFDTLGEALIKADDKAVVELVEAEISVDEGDGKVWLTLELDEIFLEDVSVKITYEGGSAYAFTDFDATPQLVTIPAGQLTTTFSVDLVEDAKPEDSEDFWVLLRGPHDDNYRVGLNSKSVVTIVNDDIIDIWIDDVVVHEDQEYATLFLQASEPVKIGLQVHFTTQQDSATEEVDYSSLTGYVRFDDSSTSGPIMIPLINDSEWEPVEFFFVRLTDAVANRYDTLPVFFLNDQAKVTLLDDEQARISIEDISVYEDAGTAEITVSLDRPVEIPISVEFSTSDQTAKSPSDYHSVSGTLFFNPGDLSRTIEISIVDADDFEINETFHIDLVNVQNAGRDVTLADDQAVVTILDKEIGTANIHFRIVNEVTSTSLNGEADSLPVNQSLISEWSAYWVEIWAEHTTPVDQGILSVQVDLSYNSEYTSATEIEFGSGFTQNQAGSINDLAGTVSGITAESTSADLGKDRPLLFARIRFAPGSEDQVLLDTESHTIGPYDLGIELTNLQVSLAGNTSVTVNEGFSPGASIYANPFDLNDDDVINYRDLILLIGLYNIIPSESDLEYTWFADFNKDDRINHRDLIKLIGNYNKSKQAPSPVNYPVNYPNAWNHLLRADTLMSPSVTADSVSQVDVISTFDSVVSQSSPVITSGQQQYLKQIDIQVIDLGGDTLGRAAGNIIYVDINAAGHGWFIDSTPADNNEFIWSSELTLIAMPDSDAAGVIDLWTVIQHELGHLLGYEHVETGLMQETLAPGIRYLPEWELNFEYEEELAPEAVDPYFSNMQDEINLHPF